MRKRSFVLALVTGLVTLLARQGAATCDPTGADAADFANARTAVAANCKAIRRLTTVTPPAKIGVRGDGLALAY